MRAFVLIVAASIAALAFTAYVGWDTTSETTTAEPLAPAGDIPTVGLPTARPEVLVLAAAGKSRKVKSVVCHAFSDDVVLCAVTFKGPSCQLWQVSDGAALGLSLLVKGATGVKTRTGVRC